ncbi:MAG: DinB family protein [Bacteroides sp.]|jgi:hypothetical protein|nr:DinB family protein [Bacteroides sp.]
MDKQAWGSQLKELRSIIRKEQFINEARALALNLHSMVYSSKISDTNQRTFEDELWENLNEETARKAVNTKGRTVVYGIWHATRIEDITMNLLVTGEGQIFEKGDWAAKTNAPVRHTGNSLDKEEIARFSELINIGELQAYRMAVARNSENIIRNLKPEEMKRGVYQANLQRILDEHAVDDVPSANWLIDFWGKKDVAGIILMPCLRHQLVHLNESMEAKKHKR